MKREYHFWHSRNLDKKMELLLFGYAGRVLLVFPTTKGRFFEYEDAGMIEALRDRLEGGELQCVCVEGFDLKTWYGFDDDPEKRAGRHSNYEKYILREVLPFIQARGNASPVSLTGCSFGGFLAMNLFFKYPHFFQRVISLGGAFDLDGFFNGLFKAENYFDNPRGYLPGVESDEYLRLLRQSEIILAVGEQDDFLPQNIRLSRILARKSIPHILDVWGEGADHEWTWWRQMIRKYTVSGGSHAKRSV